MQNDRARLSAQPQPFFGQFDRCQKISFPRITVLRRVQAQRKQKLIAACSFGDGMRLAKRFRQSPARVKPRSSRTVTWSLSCGSANAGQLICAAALGSLQDHGTLPSCACIANSVRSSGASLVGMWTLSACSNSPRIVSCSV